MYTVLIAGASGSGKSTLTAGLSSCLRAHGLSGVKAIETSNVLDQAASGIGLRISKRERQILRETISTGKFYDETKVARLMLLASEKAGLSLICGMRGDRALEYFHQRRAIDLMLVLQVEEQVALSRLIKQGRKETKEVRMARFRCSCLKLEASIKDAQRLAIPIAYIDANQSIGAVARQACGTVITDYRCQNKSA